MPVGLVVFGDKSHTDLHGSLPNLTHGKGTSDKTSTTNKIQDEHTCLSIVFRSLRQISENGGFEAVVMGKLVKIKVWIHFLIGDTEGNNKWLGQYPGNKAGVKRPYRDCKCSFGNLNNPNPNCDYIT